jgi:hypothetical protein
MPQVLIRMDDAGEWPIVVEDGVQPAASADVSYRYVCDVGTAAEGRAVCSAWFTRRLAPEARRTKEEEAEAPLDRQSTPNE